jgi:hypothetical protein
MQERSASPARAVHQFLSQQLETFRIVMVVVADHLHQPGPSASKADNLITLSQGAKSYTANRWIQARNIASSGKNSDDTFFGVDVSHNDIPLCSVENQ